MNLYKGYQATSQNEAAEKAVRELLGEPMPEVEGATDDADTQTWLTDQIPKSADDYAIRLPLPRVPLPVLELQEEDAR